MTVVVSPPPPSDVDVVDVVVVANVEDRVGNSLLQIWEMRFGHKAIFFSDIDHKV